MNIDTLHERIETASNAIDEAKEDLDKAAQAYADAVREYRKELSKAWLLAPLMRDDRKLTVPEREAWVDEQVADYKAEEILREYLLKSALENVKSKRSQMTALQTLASGERELAGFARTSPGGI